MRINYALNKKSLNWKNFPNNWSGSDIMTIDYVSVLQLKTDCDVDLYINNVTQFADYDNKMKRSITIGYLMAQ